MNVSDSFFGVQNQQRQKENQSYFYFRTNKRFCKEKDKHTK